MYGGDEVSAVVIDMGTTSTKSGFAGEDCPKFVIPSCVGIVGGEEGAAAEGSSKGEHFVGSNALSTRRDGMRIEGAMRDGLVHNWDAAESILEHTFKSCLSSNPAEHPLLMSEQPFAPAAQREKMTEIAFEK